MRQLPTSNLKWQGDAVLGGSDVMSAASDRVEVRRVNHRNGLATSGASASGRLGVEIFSRSGPEDKPSFAADANPGERSSPWGSICC
jgi:hypothetical protein